ncbi:oxidase EvaA [Nonomuraea jiangxiensis]|uniref:Oxidase EvaA n=2 Tax=Nonomuraea jiangxiensis TaxID=633440 RepID=A0A1G8RXI9_9ACTN|nr:oxidase EvaA [Nonomuraea jiangxiensis]
MSAIFDFTERRQPHWDTPSRMTASALTLSSPVTPDFPTWWAGRLQENVFDVRRVPFSELSGWDFHPETGDLAHESGRYFSVEGLAVHSGAGGAHLWSQPILNQLDIAILGILAKEFDGELHFLMQAKAEPGNLNGLQLSPTVQATPSNYTRIHRGDATPYVDYFIDTRRHSVLVDVLQSEQGAWFLRKRNRNMIVEVHEDVPVLPNFCWLTLGQIHDLLHTPNMINMDARTVLSCVPFGEPPGSPAVPRVADDSFRAAVRRSARRTDGLRELTSWLTEARCRHVPLILSIPLRDVDGWHRTEHEIRHRDGRHFSVLGVAVTTSHREVRSWTQPLLAPAGAGLAGLVVSEVDGELRLLVRADVRPGYSEGVEIGPTVQDQGGEIGPFVQDQGGEADEQARFRHLLFAPETRVRYDVELSEEGGRFHHARTRYLIAEVERDAVGDLSDDYRWVTTGQLQALLAHSRYLNIEARTLLGCLQTLW